MENQHGASNIIRIDNRKNTEIRNLSSDQIDFRTKFN